MRKMFFENLLGFHPAVKDTGSVWSQIQTMGSNPGSAALLLFNSTVNIF
jgi:hypothetical protein